jgi:outer membrane protein assembly factor BamB
MRGALTAVELEGPSGERDKRSVVWEYTQGTPDSCCPVVMADHVFMVSDDGVAKCLDATYGRSQWIKRLKGSYKASPVAAEGRIYFLNQSGLCTVVSANDRFDKLAENQLPDETIASPAVSDGRVFIRGKKFLWAVGKK